MKFWNPEIIMPKLPENLYRVEQVRELDRIAIQEFGIPGYELMNRAAMASFRIIRMNWREIDGVAIFCGSGNNAGDGYVLARLMMEARMGVVVHAVAPPSQLKGDALDAFQDYQAIGGKTIDFHPSIEYSANTLIDAILGTGVNREVTGRFAEAIETINQAGKTVISLDIPSGLNADTGVKMGEAVCANATITFIGLKQGIFTGDAPDCCGEIYFSSLDVPEDLYPKVPTTTTLMKDPDFQHRKRCAHKGKFGHVLVVGGSHGFSGAARLSGEAAARIGAGLVSIATQPEHAGYMNVMVPELMCHGVDNQQQLQALIQKATVIVIGPGLGQSKWAKELWQQVMATEDKLLVVDADALNLLAKNVQYKSNWILTPHPGEAARLLGCTTSDIHCDRFAAVSAIQKKFGGCCVLKGAGSLITDGKSILVSTTGNPGMASGGMGDVLTGVIAGLLAQGMGHYQATASSVYLHGKAADQAAEEFGERGMLASDLMVYLRQLVNPK